MKDKTNTKMPMTDSGYLKMYQLGRNRLDLKFDILLLDEAQAGAYTRPLLSSN
jgi:hypothetical protein